MLKHLEQLCQLPGVSGDEGAVRDYILEAVRPHGSARVDALGNVIVEKQGARRGDKTVLLTAHMDEVGFLITSITPGGFLTFAIVGGTDRRVIAGSRVLIGPNRVPGVIGVRAVHLLSAEERKRVPEVEEMYIDIGVSDAEAAGALVSPGDTACFVGDVFQMGNCLAAKAIDDRVGCAVLLQLMEEDLPVDCQFAFTVQEEVGCRGAMTASFQIQPDVALVLEGTTAADLPGVVAHKQVCRVGGGVVVPFIDSGTIYDRALTGRITTLADKLGIPWQTKSLVAGGTDASTIQRSGSGVQVAALAAPVRNLHTGYNVADLQDMAHLLTLTRAVLAEMG
ncbi:MAG: M42 family peptidase [Oscillospiraceae bacterium]|nr:M42 family peptidase [Oscillospiraceae bacterium]